MTGPIPAYAGEPADGSGDASGNGAYPRIRGGTSVDFATGLQIRGLSPHTRGNLDIDQVALLDVGPIPAYAGEPPCAPPGRADRRAYPRIRGGTKDAPPVPA